jgi:hypothetical protein
MIEKTETLMASMKPVSGEELSFDPRAFEAMMGKFSANASEGGQPKSMPVRKVDVIIDARMCIPGTFDTDIKVRLHSLTANDELAEMENVKGAGSLAHRMAKRSIHSCNGRVLKDYEVDMLWNAIGFAGRAELANKFMEHCTGALPVGNSEN